MIKAKTLKHKPKEKALYNFVLKERKLINKNSTKETYHIALHLPNSATYEVGDSVALYPKNKPTDCTLSLKDSPSHILIDNTPVPFLQYLQDHVQLTSIPRSLLKQTCSTLHPEAGLKTFLNTHPTSAAEFINHLRPLLPRFYSIASCPKEHPQELHLLITLHTFTVNGTEETGVFSHYISKEASIGEHIEGYVQPNPSFKPPQTAPLIMIGPGTGIAPFIGFLQKRIREQQYDNWVFFGERHKKTDFYYEEYLSSLHANNYARIDTAFSRDQEKKIYVQDLLYKHKKMVLSWIDNNATICICGDAKRMAKDVTQTLSTILQEEKGLTPQESASLLKEWRGSKKLLLDVY